MDLFYKKFHLREEEIRQIERVRRKYSMKVSKYYLSLIQEKNDPIWRQCIPGIEELQDNVNEEDPLHEEKYSPVPFLVHRYPDRVLLLVSNKCAVYCRFCTRKRKVGKTADITQEQILNAIGYIRQHSEVRDVILSGGDPLMLKESEIEFILQNLREIPHVEIIRIGTRIPCTLPQRITKRLCNMLKKYHPVYLNLHFEHPREITPESRRACGMLADAGIPLGNQCVLLKGVNDDTGTLKELFHKLASIRVKPYYLYQADQVKGTEHFRTSVQKGLEIMERMHGHTSGLCVPHYVIDAYGGGKVPVLPDYIKFKNKERLILRNFEGRFVEYGNPLTAEPAARRISPGCMRIAVVFNLKKAPAPGQPDDFYAEFDDISVPNAIKNSLERAGHHAELLEADEDIFQKLKNGSYDFVFNIAEGLHAESRESQVPAILDMLRIPYTGSGVLTQAITLDKKRTKEVLLYHGIPTPRYQIFTSSDQKLHRELNFPLIAKPNAEGSSKGIKNNSLVFNEQELMKLVRFILATYRQPALVEEFLDGREFTVAIIGNNPPKVMPIVEVTFDYLPPNVHRFDSYEVKWIWDNPSNPIDPLVCPAKLPMELEKRIEDIALKTYKLLGCVDLCRMDLRLDSRGIPNVLDVNALPGLIPDPLENSRFPRACFAARMSYDEIVWSVLDAALERYGLIENIRMKNRKRMRVRK